MYLVDLALGRGTALALALAIGSWLVTPAGKQAHTRVVVTESETTILDVVEFAPGTATLRPTSLPTLDAVADTLRGNPSIQLLEVQSHTSGRGDGAAHQTLTQQRAEVVVQYLVAAGVEPARLVAEGYGDRQPIDVAAPAKNERVSFLILRRSSDSETP
jgi:outer membrane protein OmpA-like peptidoglycan-associated protein